MFYIGRTHGVPYRSYGYVPLRLGGNVVRRMGTQQQQQQQLCFMYVLGGWKGLIVVKKGTNKQNVIVIYINK